jgi:hypothetical protein
LSSLIGRCVENGDLVSCVLNIVARWTWVIRLMISACYHWGESSRYPFYRSPSGCFRGKINPLQLLGIGLRLFWDLVYSIVIILSELSRLCLWSYVPFNQRSHATSFLECDLFVKKSALKSGNKHNVILSVLYVYHAWQYMHSLFHPCLMQLTEEFLHWQWKWTAEYLISVLLLCVGCMFTHCLSKTQR